MPGLPIADDVRQATVYLQRALELYEALDDRRGAMSTIIALAYVAGRPTSMSAPTPARRIEEIRRLSSRLRTLSHESERAAAEAQMVYGVHVFCRVEGHSRPRRAARPRGACAGARARRSVPGIPGRGWHGRGMPGTRRPRRGAAVARSGGGRGRGGPDAPSRSPGSKCRAGCLAAAGGDVPTMHQHLRKALEMAAGQDRRAARAEILAAYALECLRLGDATRRRGTPGGGRNSGAGGGARCSGSARSAAVGAAGRRRARGDCARARANTQRALELARRVIAARRDAEREDPHLEMLIPIARVMLAVGDEAEAAAMRDELQLLAGAHRAADVRRRRARPLVPRPRPAARSRRWPVRSHRAPRSGGADATGRPPTRARLLGLLIEGRSNAEIAGGAGRDPGLGRPGAWRGCTRGSARRRAPRRPSWPSAGRSRDRWYGPGPGRSAALHRRGQLHRRSLRRRSTGCRRLREGDGGRRRQRGRARSCGGRDRVPDARILIEESRRAAADPGAARPTAAPTGRRRRSCSRISSVRPASPRCWVTRRGRRCSAGTTRRCEGSSRSTTGTRSSRPATASSSASTRRGRDRVRRRDPADARGAPRGTRVRAEGADRHSLRDGPAGGRQLPRQGRPRGSADRRDRVGRRDPRQSRRRPGTSFKAVRAADRRAEGAIASPWRWSRSPGAEPRLGVQPRSAQAIFAPPGAWITTDTASGPATPPFCANPTPIPMDSSKPGPDLVHAIG